MGFGCRDDDRTPQERLRDAEEEVLLEAVKIIRRRGGTASVFRAEARDCWGNVTPGIEALISVVETKHGQ
jgi:hypothetical protein